MAVGDPGKARYPMYPRSEKPGVHMQPRGAGVRFKMLSRGRYERISTKNSQIIARINITLPHHQHSHGENSPQLSELPASADRATRFGEVSHFTCERDQEIKRDCMERLVTPPRRGTSPSRGPPPSCEQALSVSVFR